MNLPAALPRIVGAKLPLRPMHVWTIRVRLQIERRVRDLALFDIALDSKLRGCDVVALRLTDIMAAGTLRRRATIIQQKTGRPVQFEITDQARRRRQRRSCRPRAGRQADCRAASSVGLLVSELRVGRQPSPSTSHGAERRS